MRFLYNILFYCLIPFELVRLLWRSRKYPAYRKRLSERFAFKKLENLEGCIWLHAVSAGESLASVPLIDHLREQHPNVPILVTTTTPTGSELVQKVYPNGEVAHVYKPFDLPGATKRFIKQIKPRCLILMEKELWPNTLFYCKKQHIPVYLLNAMLTQESADKYARIKGFTLTMLQALTAIAAQDQATRDRYCALGVAPEKIHVTGNMKFDRHPPEIPEATLQALRETLTPNGNTRPVWLAASTHAGEEDVLLKIHKEILTKLPDALLIVVPRHPERFEAVGHLIGQTGLSYVKRTSGQACPADCNVYLADTLGELMALYHTAPIAFVGGSLQPIGGHNILEPAMLGKAIVVGPHTFNFDEITADFVANNALIQADDAKGVAKAIFQFLQDAAAVQQYSDNALNRIQANRGALHQQLNIVLDSLRNA